MRERQPRRFWQSPPGTSAPLPGGRGSSHRAHPNPTGSGRWEGKELAPQQRGSRGMVLFYGSPPRSLLPIVENCHPGWVDAAAGAELARLGSWPRGTAGQRCPRGRGPRGRWDNLRGPGSSAVRLEGATLASDGEGFRTYN